MKMKPSWFYSGKYQCKYKNKVVIYITIKNDEFIVTVATADAQWNVFVDCGEDKFIQTLNDEMKKEFANHFKQCSGCSYKKIILV